MKKDFTDISVINMVCVYDVSFCEKNNIWYYSYMDPHIGFDGGCRRMPKNVFLKRYESINNGVIKNG